jgi:flagellar hook-basal body complex protein FliE
MTIDPISLAAQAMQSSMTTAKVEGGHADFGTWLSQQIGSVNQYAAEAETQVRQLAVGEAANLHQVMMSLEKAKLSFDVVVQVRNKLLDAYQEIMRMQI